MDKLNLTENEKRDVIKYLESGSTADPRIKTVNKIANALGVMLDDIMKE